MQSLQSLIQNEKSHFQRLHLPAQRLLISFFLYSLISPLFSLFINAFLWRESHDFVQVALFNLIFYLAIPIGFYLNGYLMKRFPSNQLYILGLVSGAFVISTLIFLNKITIDRVIIFGFIDGITAGIYWANRNWLTFKLTKSDNRIYFSGLETSSNTITGIVVPFFIGLVITAGIPFGLYTPLVGYKILAIAMLVVSALIGVHILAIKNTQETITNLWLKSASKRWQKFRWYEVFIGFLTGSVNFLPTFMVFLFIGNEEALGAVQSVSALITAFVVYQFAKKLSVSHRLALVIWSIIINIAGAAFFSVFYSAIGVFAFLISAAVTWPLLWVAINSLNYDLIDEDNQSHLHYAYLCDQEIYLNLGRILAIIVFIALIFLGSKSTGLRFAPLIYAVCQIFLYFLAKSLENTKKPA